MNILVKKYKMTSLLPYDFYGVQPMLYRFEPVSFLIFTVACLSTALNQELGIITANEIKMNYLIFAIPVVFAPNISMRCPFTFDVKFFNNPKLVFPTLLIVSNKAPLYQQSFASFEQSYLRL